ncbi:MAG TPA: OsmC family protein [Stellaceae bacterium]|nr:OsmC family protein [Stellaceae bacterium]
MSDTPAGPELPPVSPGSILVVESGEGLLKQYLLDGRHRLVADEPTQLGGSDAGPNPYELLLMSLGACTAMTLRLYARRKQWPLERIAVRLRHQRIHAEDCAECETRIGFIDRIECEIELAGPLDAAQRQRLLEIADMCPVHRTLTSEINVRSRLAPA